MTKPVTNRKIYRTTGDTDPFRFRLRNYTDGDIIVDVQATATVEMHIATTPTVTTIAGVEDGQGLGYWSFDTVGLPVVNGLAYEIEVTEPGGVYTHTCGTIVEKTQID